MFFTLFSLFSTILYIHFVCQLDSRTPCKAWASVPRLGKRQPYRWALDLGAPCEMREQCNRGFAVSWSASCFYCPYLMESCSVEFTLSRCLIQWGQYSRRVVQASALIPDHFHRPRKKPHPPLPSATANLWMKKIEAKTRSYRRFWNYHLQTTFVEPHRELKKPSGDPAPDLPTRPVPAWAGGWPGTCIGSHWQ